MAGWLGLIGGPLEYLDNIIKTIQNIANKANKDPNRFRVILLTYPNVDINSRNQSGTTSQGQRFPLTGTIDQIGSDIERIKQIGVGHIVFGYNFIPTGRDLDNMLDITKQLARLAR